MEFLSAIHTDIGIRKNTNQDCVSVKIAETPIGQIAFLVLCDGMGGLDKGEVASRAVLDSFNLWFENDFPQMLLNGFDENELKELWNTMLLGLNQKIINYGKACGTNLGTTVTAILIMPEYYFITHVGDSRAYEITENLLQLTKDQTVVAREVEMGKLTQEQAAQDPRRNVLLQCIGASNVVEPDFITGQTRQNAVYFLCCDGFRHVITPQEIYNCFSPKALITEEAMIQNAIYLTELNKQRNENDNISVVIVRTI